MAKCKACGAVYADGSRFCASCGASVVDDNTVIAEALQNAQKDFDRDSMATLDKSRITYVCSICGSINRIDQDKCTRCGKPRPRSEYVTALKRINESKAMNAETAETLVAPLPVQAEPVVQEPVVQEPIVEEKPAVPELAQPVVQNVMAVGGQGGAISQPFVVVPYVDSMYPLRQYNPNQLYRYQPYTPEELAAIKAQREAEELQARLQAQASMPQEETAPVCECGVDAKKVKSFGIGTLILSIIMFLLGAYSIVGIVTDKLVDFASLGNADLMFVGGYALATIMGLVGIIHSSVRIAGKCNCRGWIIGLLYIVGFAVAFVGGIFMASGEISMVALSKAMSLDLFLDNAITIALFVVPALVDLIVCACSPRAKKCKSAK